MRRIRRRAHARWWALAISGLLHTGTMIVLSAALQPVDLGHVGKLLLTAEMAPEPQTLEALDLPDIEIADAMPGESLFELSDDLAAAGDLAAVIDISLDEGDGPPPPDPPELALDLAAEIVPPVVSQPALPTSRRRRDADRAGQQASFFGTVAHGDAFVYVLDMSGSMAGPRFERAREELAQSVEALREKQRFYVLLFNSGTRRMFDDDSSADEAVLATAKNKRRLREWLLKVRPDGGTDPRDALRIGLGLRPSALFLLSDGEFNMNGQNSRQRLRHGDSKPSDMIGERSQKKIPIHTFAYESASAVATMKTLASETGGVYRFVAAGPPQPANRAAPAQPPAARLPVNDVLAMQESQALLTAAELLASQGNFVGAIAEYQKIIDTYPQTNAAEQAKWRKGLLSLFVLP